MDFSVSGELEDIFVACTSEQELGESHMKRNAFGLWVFYLTLKSISGLSFLLTSVARQARWMAFPEGSSKWQASPRAQVTECGTARHIQETRFRVRDNLTLRTLPCWSSRAVGWAVPWSGEESFHSWHCWLTLRFPKCFRTHLMWSLTMPRAMGADILHTLQILKTRLRGAKSLRKGFVVNEYRARA